MTSPAADATHQSTITAQQGSLMLDLQKNRVFWIEGFQMDDNTIIEIDLTNTTETAKQSDITVALAYGIGDLGADDYMVLNQIYFGNKRTEAWKSADYVGTCRSTYSDTNITRNYGYGETAKLTLSKTNGTVLYNVTNSKGANDTLSYTDGMQGNEFGSQVSYSQGSFGLIAKQDYANTKFQIDEIRIKNVGADDYTIVEPSILITTVQSIMLKQVQHLTVQSG
jgi:hypothetical protein